MASIPTASYNAMRVHESLRNQKKKMLEANMALGISDYSCPETNAHNYNSKMMNSIWGLYNRYAPWVFQKNMEERLIATASTKATLRA